MSTTNGSDPVTATPEQLQADLKRVTAELNSLKAADREVLIEPPPYIVADSLDAERLQVHGYRVLCLEDGQPLLRKDLKSLTQLVVLQRPGENGIAFGVQVRERLGQLKWVGTLTRCSLPDRDGDLVGFEARVGRDMFRAELSTLAAAGLSETYESAPAKTPAAHESQADTLVKIALATELFRTPDGQLYARVPVNAHHEVMALEERGSGFQRWLVGQFYLQTGHSPSTSAVAQAVEVVRAKAQFDGPVHEVWTRLAWTDEAIYLDLANAAWEVVQITAEGWDVITQPPVYFRRPRGMLPLPQPEREGTMQALHTLTTVPEGSDEEKLIDAWLLQALMPEGPYTDLCLHGEQGSTKSVLTKILRQTIDPNKAPARRAPKDEHDLVIAAQNARVVALENLSHLPDWLSDALCCLSTGAGFSTRKLYTDDDEAIFAAKRPVIMNGIAEVAVRGDLIDRCLFVTLPRLQEAAVKEEKQLWADFAKAHPRILGALLHATSEALKNRPTLKIERLPRMADFTLWVEAAAPVFGWEPEAFLQAYRRNRKDAVKTGLEASPVARALLTYLDGLAEDETVDRVLMGELLEALTAQTFDDRKKSPPKDWPKSPQAFGSVLRRLAPALRAQGFEVTIHKPDKRGTPVSIVNVSGEESGGEVGGEVGGELPLGGELPAEFTTATRLEGPGNAQNGGEGGELSSISSVRKEGKEEEERGNTPLKREPGKGLPPSPPSPRRGQKRDDWTYPRPDRRQEP